MFTQLNPPIPVSVEEKGNGYAIAVIDYGLDHHLLWVVALDADCTIWTAANPCVRVRSNWTAGR